jgi:superfamily II DNA or RNA helicase
MKKAVLSNRIIMTATPELKEEVRSKLTYSIAGYNEYQPVLQLCNLKTVRDGLISIPIGRKDLIPEDYTVVDKRVLMPTDFPEFKFDLRESQKAVYDDIDDNSIINAAVSWGKTFTGLAIAGKLAQKTLIVVHTIPLRNQWAKECEKVFGFKPGIIGGKEFDTSKPITIGNVQTLYNRPNIVRMFGTVILDEMHHVSSPTFGKILDSNCARYKIGLSGTIERKDGYHVVFRDYFGDRIYKPKRENSMTPVIHRIMTNVPLQDSMKVPWAVKINNLMARDDYRHTTAILAASYAAQGHNVLVLADRVEFLEAVTYLVGDSAALIVGKTKDRDEILASVGKTKNVLCGTQKIFSEGISHNPLSCIILGTPVNNDPLLMQIIGRAVRELEGKKQPVIVDINLKGRTAERQAMSRLGHYIKEEYEVKQIWI